MSLSDCIYSQFLDNLRNRYDALKTKLEDERFTPDASEVWKMYSHVFYENTGACDFAESLLGLKTFGDNGKLNDFQIYLDDMNKKASDYCTAYVTAMNKSK